jgi:hypothetical protein
MLWNNVESKPWKLSLNWDGQLEMLGPRSGMKGI